MMFWYENSNSNHSQIFKKIFFITIIHETASLLIRNFYFEVYFQSTFKIKKSINKKLIHTKVIMEKASVVQTFVQGSHLKKNTTQSKKSNLSDSPNMPNLSVGWIHVSWHASNYKPHSTFRLITNRHVNIYKLVWKLSCRGIQKLYEPVMARAYVAMYGTLGVTNA